MHECMSHGKWLDHEPALRLIELVTEGGIERLRALVARAQDEKMERRLRNIEDKLHSQASQIERTKLVQRVHIILDFFDFF